MSTTTSGLSKARSISRKANLPEACARLDALGHFQQCRVVAGGVDHELERQALAGAGQRGQVEAEDLQAADFCEFGLHQRQQAPSACVRRSTA
jgi:hypothetical protein